MFQNIIGVDLNNFSIEDLQDIETLDLINENPESNIKNNQYLMGHQTDKIKENLSFIFIQELIKLIKRQLNVFDDNFDEYLEYMIENGIENEKILETILSEEVYSKLVKSVKIKGDKKTLIQAKRCLEVVAFALLKCPYYDCLKSALETHTNLSQIQVWRIIKEYIPYLSKLNPNVDVGKWLPQTKIYRITYENCVKLSQERGNLEFDMTRSEFKIAMDNRGATIPSQVKLNWRCTIYSHHTWDASYNDIKSSGHGCRHCAEIYGFIGKQLHKVIQYIITTFFLRLGLKIYSEVIVSINKKNKRKTRIVDSFLLNINNKKFLMNRLFKCPRLLKELRLDKTNLENIEAFMFDYTNDISDENIKEKSSKYQKENMILFIIGTRWKKWRKDARKRVLDTFYKNVRVIRFDLFAELIGLEGELLRDFEYGLELSHSLDLDALREFCEELFLNFFQTFGRDLYRTQDLITELDKLNIDYYSFLDLEEE